MNTHECHHCRWVGNTATGLHYHIAIHHETPPGDPQCRHRLLKQRGQISGNCDMCGVPCIWVDQYEDVWDEQLVTALTVIEWP